ncbi:protein ROOT INITIATION DEFECTIVE 3-like isoform X2 [Quercus lobata]|uniref:protein ROOT INITIATION DEFECTIVE 3-like isoform X2 n=1 Tax=Quercus lobata TaxID=97700 RepID=UPI0012455EAB|nr:protein ROOT INITIATION DEFECTIVE 3-like isoform X2 [Quercus lobata]
MSSSSSHEIVLTSSPDGPIIAYDASSGALLAHFTGTQTPRQGLTLVGNSTLIAASHISSATGSGSIHLYNWWSSTVFHHLPLPEPVAPLIASLDGFYLFAGGLSGGDDGTMVVIPISQLIGASSSTYENASNFILHRFVAHADSVTAITCGIGLCNSTIIISCSLDCTCKFWNLLLGTHLRTVEFPCTVFGVALDPTESEFYVAGSEGFIYKGTMKVESKQLVSQGLQLVKWAQKHGGAIVSLVMMNEGQNLISAAEDGSVWVWEAVTGQVIMTLQNEMGSISHMVVATGRGARMDSSGSNESTGNWSLGLSGTGRELSLQVKQTQEMEDMLTVVAKDRSKAIDMLESAIEMYERLLELILKEAKKGTSNGGE